MPKATKQGRIQVAQTFLFYDKSATSSFLVFSLFQFLTDFMRKSYHFLTSSKFLLYPKNFAFLQPLAVNPFHATDLFWYSLKTSDNHRFSDVFRGCQKRSVTWNGLNDYKKYSLNNYYQNLKKKRFFCLLGICKLQIYEIATLRLQIKVTLVRRLQKQGRWKRLFAIFSIFIISTLTWPI